MIIVTINTLQLDVLEIYYKNFYYNIKKSYKYYK